MLIDGSDSTVSAGALAAVNGVVADQNLEILASSARGDLPMAAQPIILFNPEGRTANYIIPGLVAILMQMIAIFLASGSIVRERERGTMEQLMVTPVHPLGLMLGKVAPYLVLGIGETALILAIMRFAFAVPIQGSLVFLFGIMVVYLAALLAFGLFISTRAKTEMEAMQMAQMRSCCARQVDTFLCKRQLHLPRSKGMPLCSCRSSGRSCRRRTWSR